MYVKPSRVIPSSNKKKRACTESATYTCIYIYIISSSAGNSLRKYVHHPPSGMLDDPRKKMMKHRSAFFLLSLLKETAFASRNDGRIPESICRPSTPTCRPPCSCSHLRPHLQSLRFANFLFRLSLVLHGHAISRHTAGK